MGSPPPPSPPNMLAKISSNANFQRGGWGLVTCKINKPNSYNLRVLLLWLTSNNLCASKLKKQKILIMSLLCVERCNEKYLKSLCHVEIGIINNSKIHKAANQLLFSMSSSQFQWYFYIVLMISFILCLISRKLVKQEKA